MSQNVYCISLVLALLAATTFSQNPYGGGYSASGVAPPAAAPPPSAAASAAPPPPQPASSAAPPPPPPAPASAAGTGYSQEQAAAAPPPASPPPPPPAAAAYPAPAPPAPAPSAPVQQTGYGTDLSKTHGASNLGFPLPSCYINKDGFMCCNKELENLMDNTYRNLSQSRNGKWKKCNIHQVAVATQRNAQKHFGVDFELVVGAGDYASKNYFNQDLICKIRRDNSIILAFATPN